MIKGIYKDFVKNIRVTGNSLYFIASGKIIIDSVELFKGQGMFCTQSVVADITADKVSCLQLSFDDAEIERILLSLGISRQNRIFDFAMCDEFVSMSGFFFGEEKEYENKLLSCGIAQSFLSYIIPPHKSGEQPESLCESYVRRTEKYINENLHKRIKIDTIAAELSLSRGYLRNLFYKYKGISPQEYMMQKRMERAKELLGQNELTVTDVAAAVGYTDVLQFSRIFKKHVEMSPTRYRESLGIQHDNIIRKHDNAIPEKVCKDEKAIIANAEKSSAEYAEPETSLDITAALALEIEKAAIAASISEKQKEEEKKSPPPFWLL